MGHANVPLSHKHYFVVGLDSESDNKALAAPAKNREPVINAGIFR